MAYPHNYLESTKVYPLPEQANHNIALKIHQKCLQKFITSGRSASSTTRKLHNITLKNIYKNPSPVGARSASSTTHTQNSQKCLQKSITSGRSASSTTRKLHNITPNNVYRNPSPVGGQHHPPHGNCITSHSKLYKNPSPVGARSVSSTTHTQNSQKCLQKSITSGRLASSTTRKLHNITPNNVYRNPSPVGGQHYPPHGNCITSHSKLYKNPSPVGARSASSTTHTQNSPKCLQKSITSGRSLL